MGWFSKPKPCPSRDNKATAKADSDFVRDAFNSAKEASDKAAARGEQPR